MSDQTFVDENEPVFTFLFNLFKEHAGPFDQPSPEAMAVLGLFADTSITFAELENFDRACDENPALRKELKRLIRTCNEKSLGK